MVMGWIEDITTSIEYIESHIEEELNPEIVSANVNLSAFYFQKGFTILCGVTVSEYIRNRRLSLAGRELLEENAKVIDVALKYGYESPDSFAKAFTRFHGITPVQAKNGEGQLKNYLPLKLQLSMKGGFEMECKIVKKASFTVVGMSKIIKMEDGYKECPAFWDELIEKGVNNYLAGTYAICIDDDAPAGSFKYMIAEDYIPSKEMGEGFETVVIPENTWAVFPCKGPLPKTLQEVNSKIYSEWLLGNSDYDLAGTYDIEFYTNPADYPNGNKDDNYYCEIWLPVKAKK